MDARRSSSDAPTPPARRRACRWLGTGGIAISRHVFGATDCGAWDLFCTVDAATGK